MFLFPERGHLASPLKKRKLFTPTFFDQECEEELSKIFKRPKREYWLPGDRPCYPYLPRDPSHFKVSFSLNFK